MKRLEEEVAVVTGGNGGIALATTRLQQEGTKLAISGQNRKIFDEAGKALGNGALTIRADEAKLADMDHFHAEVRRTWAELMWCS